MLNSFNTSMLYVQSAQKKRARYKKTQPTDFSPWMIFCSTPSLSNSGYS